MGPIEPKDLQAINSPYHTVIRGQMAVISALLESITGKEGIAFLEIKNKDSFTALHLASTTGNTAIVNFLF
jgi:ankyrin repeat protein